MHAWVQLYTATSAWFKIHTLPLWEASTNFQAVMVLTHTRPLSAGSLPESGDCWWGSPAGEWLPGTRRWSKRGSGEGSAENPLNKTQKFKWNGTNGMSIYTHFNKTWSIHHTAYIIHMLTSGECCWGGGGERDDCYFTFEEGERYIAIAQVSTWEWSLLKLLQLPYLTPKDIPWPHCVTRSYLDSSSSSSSSPVYYYRMRVTCFRLIVCLSLQHGNIGYSTIGWVWHKYTPAACITW